ncbi:MAG: SDR family oxidoreductase [Gammaproteobacteria bacterium]|nr:SDR family oxidoreductase [Gammaproteobacteria bacterium]
MTEFNDKVAVITGGGSGIGAALCRELARRGARVLCADLAADTARGVVDEITKAGGRATAYPLDVTHAEQVAALVATAIAEHGRIDFMFNNAGISVTGDARDLTLTHWRHVIDVNLMGVVYGSDSAYKQMATQGFGHIVNIASLAGLIPFPTNAPYATTKHAVVGLSQSLRAEGEDLGVRVSAVCPGFIQSNIYKATPFINVDRERALTNMPFTPVPAERAANLILRGVLRNDPIIIFPGYARVVWYVQRLKAALLNPLHRKGIRDLRKLRGK